MKPYEDYLEFDVSRAWFWSKVPRSAEMGELILGEKHLIITFRFSSKEENCPDKIAWDSNEKSIDGFNPKLGTLWSETLMFLRPQIHNMPITIQLEDDTCSLLEKLKHEMEFQVMMK